MGSSLLLTHVSVKSVGNNGDVYDFMRFNGDGMSYLLIIPRKALIDALGVLRHDQGHGVKSALDSC